MREEAVVVLRLDGADLQAKSQQAAQSLAKIGQAGEVSARQTAQAMRMLAPQMTDIATQLAGGQNPLLILLQQGGQIKDQFGGVGNAIRGIGAAISPVTIAVGAAAAVVGTFGAAAWQAAKEGAALRDTMALTGNAAGLTAGRFEALGIAVSDASQQTVGASKAIVMELAKSGQVSGEVLASMAKAVARVADVSGESAEKVAQDFARMGSGVATWAAEHNKAWNFISVEQYKYIRRLEEQGEAEKAVMFVNERLTARLEGQRRELGLLESAWDSVRRAASGAWDAMVSIGRPSTTRQQLDIAMDRLQSLPLTGRAREAAEQRVQLLKEQLRLENQAADAQSRTAATNRREIADERERERQRGGRGGRTPPPASSRLFDSHVDEWERMSKEWRKDPLGDFITDKLNAQDQRDERVHLRWLSDLAREDRRGEGGLRDALYNDTRNALRAALRDSKDPAKAFARALGAAVYSQLTDSVADALTTALVGKEGGGGGGLLGGLIGLVGGIVGGGMSVDTSGIGIGSGRTDGFIGLPTRGGMASGTNYVPRDMIVKVHRGEAIVPARYNPDAGGAAGGRTVNFAPVINVNGAMGVQDLEAMLSRQQYQFARRFQA